MPQPTLLFRLDKSTESQRPLARRLLYEVLDPAGANRYFSEQARSMLYRVRAWANRLQQDADPQVAKLGHRIFFCRPWGGWMSLPGPKPRLVSQSCRLRACPWCHLRRVLALRAKLDGLQTPLVGLYGARIATEATTARGGLLAARKTALKLLRASGITKALLGVRLYYEAEPGSPAAWQIRVQALCGLDKPLAAAPGLTTQTLVRPVNWEQHGLVPDTLTELSGYMLWYQPELLDPKFQPLLKLYLEATSHTFDWTLVGL